MKNFFDVKNEIKNILDQYLDSLARGNEGHANVDELDFDEGIITFKATVIHKHANYIRNPFTGKRSRVEMYSVEQSVSAKINLLKPEQSDMSICVSSPVGDVCASLKDIIDIIISIMGA